MAAERDAGLHCLGPLVFSESHVRGVQLEDGKGLGLAITANLPTASDRKARRDGGSLVSVLDEFDDAYNSK